MAGSEKIGVSAGNCEAQGKQERLKSVIIAGTCKFPEIWGIAEKQPRTLREGGAVKLPKNWGGLRKKITKCNV